MKSLKFSHWVHWDNRASLDALEYPGIYALATSKVKLEGSEFSLLKNIVYFGMTNSKAGLRGRLAQFNNTLRDKSGAGHGGADRFRYDFIDGEKLAKILFVSVCNFKCDVRSQRSKDLLVMGKVAIAEYQALAAYANQFGGLPKYNDKQTSPKHSKRTSPL